jgi:membrane-bound ClpP family serine protease
MDQVLPAAIVAVILILVIAGIVRAASRRRSPHEDAFGAGGTTTVASGTPGVAATDLAPTGVIRAVGEEWSARSADGTTIPEGADVRVVDHDGLTLIVRIDRPSAAAGE